MAQLFPLKGLVLRIFIKVFVQLSYLFSVKKKKSSSHWYKIEGLSLFLYYRCAQHRNLYQRGDVCHWLFFTSVCGLSPSKAEARCSCRCEGRRSEQLLLHRCSVCWLLLHPCSQRCIRTREERRGAQGEGSVGSSPWSALLCSAQPAAAEDLTCSLSGVLFCCSDNSIMKGHNLFLLCTLCSSILPPLLFPESLIWEYRKCCEIKQDVMKCCLFIHWLVSLFFSITSSLGFGDQESVPRDTWGLWRLLQRFDIPSWLCRLGKSVRSARSLLLTLSLIFTLYPLLEMFQKGKSWEAFLRVS